MDFLSQIFFNEKNLLKISLIISATGLIFLLVFPQNNFQEKTISELVSSNGTKGLIHGQIQKVITNYPSCFFVLSDSNSAVFYSLTGCWLKAGDFVDVYAQNIGKKEMFVHRVEIK
jgi:hypothetical protein